MKSASELVAMMTVMAEQLKTQPRPATIILNHKLTDDEREFVMAELQRLEHEKP